MQSRNVEAKAGRAQETKRVPYRELSVGGKAAFICKVVVCVVTGGFVFPNVMERGK